MDLESVSATLELQQLISDYWHELDSNGARNVTDDYTEDCEDVAGASFNLKGRAGVRQFYDERAKHVATEKDGIRNTRHLAANVRIALKGKDRASVEFVMVNYSGAGKPPVTDFTGPSMVADVFWECVREADGKWRLASFRGAPLFIGNEGFIGKVLGKN